MSFLHLFFAEFNEGGFLMWVIFFVTVIIWIIGVEKSISLWKFSLSRKRFLKLADSLCNGNIQPQSNTGLEHYDFLLNQLHHSINGNKTGYKGMMREFLISTAPLLEKHLSTMSVWISITPLLGLLGTVIGMIETFRIIMDFGVGNPGLTAKGISMALLTTQAGLTAAFPALIFYNYLINRKNTLINHILKDFETLINQLNSSQSEYRKD